MNQAKRESQLNAWLAKNRRVAMEAQNGQERDYIFAMWAGFLNGLRMTNAITQREYNAYFNDFKVFVQELEGKRA